MLKVILVLNYLKIPKLNLSIKLVFGINLHVKDLPILLSFKDTLGVGTVSTKGKVTSYTVKT